MNDESQGEPVKRQWTAEELLGLAWAIFLGVIIVVCVIYSLTKI